ncbi:aminopeptidase N [Pararhizobium mangrovi]|uniref:Aminopeptidase N n=1 Tax=Pararhizobium mangrovi TaxID=2590452 RepID=A0A506U8M9_9HYPH|nr:aminopeptidase N [Pararhizobium mangrovi]TPW29858.1 aminopeptidase N [Pararhizobium mangrovi]
MRTETGTTFQLSDYRESDFIVDAVDLTFRLDPERTEVVSTLTVRRRPGVSPDAPFVLDGDEVELKSVSVDGQTMAEEDVAETGNGLRLSNLPGQAAFSLTITSEIAPERNTQLMGLYRSSGVYTTQCEAEGFRRITFFPDRPDVLAVYTTRIEADRESAPLLLANGNCIETGDLGEGRHYAVWHDPHPKPSYLFALVAGDLGVLEDDFTTASGREVALKIYVEHGKEARAAYAMDSLKRSMRWDEERFGREYDLDIFMIVAVSDFNMGAMENKGLNVFNDKYVLADPEIATDADYANIEAIIAHEYFHNWTGNRITCRDWFQLCLKEGLTVYRDHEFSADQRSRPVKRIAEVRLLKAHQFPEDAGPLAHPVRPDRYREISNFYTATVYEKGSEVVRMIATLLGEDGFRKGMDLYFDRHDGEAATIEDFLACFEDATGFDLGQFRLWYDQAGTPVVSVSTVWDPGSRRFTASFEQSVPATPGQAKKDVMHIPLRFGLVLPDGSEAEPTSVTGARVTDDVLHLTQRSQTVQFDGVSARPVLSLNRGFCAPINVHFEQAPADLAHLARHESDPFARWQALNAYAMRVLVEAVAKERAGGTVDVDPALAETMIATAEDETLEPAFRAQALALPGENDIAREIGNDIDPDAIFAARRAVQTVIGKTGAEIFARLADTMETPGAYSPDAASAGKRAFRHALMTYLSLADASPARANEAFAAADNMTDLSQPLLLLAHFFPESEGANAALATFEERFHDTPLVIDKWLSAQATAPGAATLERVRMLMEGEHFSRSNPNRVRALIGAFAAGNPTGFNRADGAGFAFLADEVLAIDGRNPQVAARLLTTMRSWRSLEEGRRRHARAALERIAAADKLSSDVRDIVDRTLAG